MTAITRSYNSPNIENSIPYSPRSSKEEKVDRITEVSIETLKNLHAARSDTIQVFRESKFTILFTGDTHSYLDPSVAKFVSEKPLGGVLRRIQYFKKTVDETKEPVLILDAGDFFHGTPYYEMFKGKPEIQFMNMANYHLVTIGNHDLEEGWEHLEKLLSKGSFKAVCANIFKSDENKPCLEPYSLLKIDDKNVAIVGVMGLDAWKSIRPSARSNLRIEDPKVILDELLPDIRPYVDLIILLSHSGIKDDKILAEHPLVDIVVGGHSHTLMSRAEIVERKVDDMIKKSYVFHGFRHGQLVARLDIDLSHNHLVNVNSSVEHLDDRYDFPNQDSIPNEPAVALLDRYKQKMKNRYDQKLGECVESLPSGDKMNQLTPLGEAVADVLRRAAGADVGVISSGGIKVGFEEGPVTVGVVHNMLAHEEELWSVTMSGSLLINLMREGHKRWGQPRTFQYAGITLEIKDSEIQRATINGRTIDKDEDYTMAGPSFFFEREIMSPNLEILPELKEQVKFVEVKAKDLRDPFKEIIKTQGLGRWIKRIS
ncbi:MAG: nucleotidase [Chlamydiales bacterium]|jgi:2',3'-cyclic-nucleotide 2'-phosphodiesterase (5'-nucleotidase family)|nr:nucleotidase [Chlamydiales bacterium]